MKKILLLFALSLMVLSCNVSAKNEVILQNNASKTTNKNYVEVLYFHGKQRCATCIAIEENTKYVMQKYFAKQIKDGNVIFKVIDISKKENEKIAEKYEVTWSSLFLVKHKDGQETSKNMTEFAFGNAYNSPDVFKTGMVKSVNEMLK